MNRQITRLLRNIFQAREKFGRDDEIDKVEREKLMKIMKNGYQEEVQASERSERAVRTPAGATK